MRVWEYLKNACLGWQNYLDAEKYIVFFFLILLIFWLRNRWDSQKHLLNYSVAMAVLCIFPPTAVLLMLYQTRFYDYQWILAMIPVNTVIAMGGTLLLDWLFDNRRVKTRDKALVIGAMLFILALSGSKPETGWMVKDTKAEKAIASEVLSEIPGDGGLLWAPTGILEYSRELRPDIPLLYGRNMWQEDMNSFSYDVYDEKAVECYNWMYYAQIYYAQLEQYVARPDWYDYIEEQNVHYIVLPAALEDSIRLRIEWHYRTESKKIGDYYLLTL